MNIAGVHYCNVVYGMARQSFGPIADYPTILFRFIIRAPRGLRLIARQFFQHRLPSPPEEKRTGESNEESSSW